MPITLPADQKALQKLVDRRHPTYAHRLEHWEFCRDTYEGGRDWFEKNLFSYHKEGKTEFDDRKKRAYRFNHTREVVHLVTKYIFKSEVIRNVDDAPEGVKGFWKKATVKGLGIDALMRRASDLASTFGRTWIITDSRIDEAVVTRADEKQAGGTVFAYTVTPIDMLDYAWDETGALIWVLYRITSRDDADPVISSGAVRARYMIWTRESFAVLEDNGLSGSKRKISVVRADDHKLGEVPAIAMDDFESDDPYDVPALIGDVAYLDRSIANYLSNLDAIIQDQTFSQLTIPSQGLLPGDEGANQVREMGTKRIFTYDAEGGAAPAYISPDPKQAQLILETINKIIGEIYHSIGMAGERTKQDNAVGIDNSSGVAKAYDFERVNSLLTSKADVLERAEDALMRQVALWKGEKLPSKDGSAIDLVKYPDSFDVRGLYDEFEIADNLSLLSAPDELRREQMRSLIKKLFPRMAQERADEIEKALKEWPPEPPELLAPPVGLAKGLPGQNRQGQVTKTSGGATPTKPAAKPAKTSSPKPATAAK